ncbi:MAG: ribonuclease P protein component [Candidatus Kapaibacteriota bacterium]
MNYKLETIKRKKVFELLFANGKRFSIGSLRLVVLPRGRGEPEAELNKIFYAVQVSKKATKKAVVRNRIKRLLRESLRYLARSGMKEKLHSFKYIFLGWVDAPQRACEISLKDILPIVEKGLTVASEMLVEKGKEKS